METTLSFDVPIYAIWDWRVVADLFFGGIGVGAFLFAVLLDVRYQGKYQRICQTAAISSPLFVILGMVFLMMKMGRPAQLLLTFTNWAPTSPLWWGGIFQVLFVIGALVIAWMWLDPESNSAKRQNWSWAVLPLAMIVGAYHGFLLSVFRSRPLWNAGPTVVAAILGFITTGIAMVLLLHLIRMQLAGRLRQTEWVTEFISEIREMRVILGTGLVLQIFTLFLWWISLKYGVLGDRMALEAANSTLGPLFWWVGIFGGLALPLLLGGIMVVQGKKISLNTEINVIWLTSGLILIGGFIFRYAVVMGGQTAMQSLSMF